MIAEAIHTGQSFEQIYLSLREKEGRLYTDEQLMYLPDIANDHSHFAEWELRKESYLRLENYLKKRVFPMKILEVGCGNGWLSHRLSSLTGSVITGYDINRVELQQAQRVFSHVSNLQFTDHVPKEEKDHDLVIFAASIQYFSSFKEIINTSIQQLKPGGEIHILDTHFYKKEEIKEARQRTTEHFNRLGFPEMSSLYFHHSIDELNSFRHETFYQPSFFQRQFYSNKNPFPWICIKEV